MPTNSVMGEQLDSWTIGPVFGPVHFAFNMASVLQAELFVLARLRFTDCASRDVWLKCFMEHYKGAVDFQFCLGAQCAADIWVTQDKDSMGIKAILQDKTLCALAKDKTIVSARWLTCMRNQHYHQTFNDTDEPMVVDAVMSGPMGRAFDSGNFYGTGPDFREPGSEPVFFHIDSPFKLELNGIVRFQIDQEDVDILVEHGYENLPLWCDMRKCNKVALYDSDNVCVYSREEMRR